jgi:hypothetical protein
MPKYLVPLYSGIGNVIQSIPFANEMKRRYGNVVSSHGSDFPMVSTIVADVFDKIYNDKSYIADGYTRAIIPKRRHYPEYKSWFVDNNEELPEKYSMAGISAYSDFKYPKSKYVIWPECKPNWLCKQWPYYPELASQLDDVTVVGLDRTIKFGSSVKDYRGKLSLLQTGSILKNAEIFIGNEGGMAHYAAALGTKTYAILGCGDPVKSLAPNNMHGISLNLSCQPCHLKNMVVNGIMMIGCEHRKCLNNLSVKKVLEIVLNG